MLTPAGTPIGATVCRRALARMHAAFNAHAGIAPGHQVGLPFQEGIEVGIGCLDQVGARTALLRDNGIPVLRGRGYPQVFIGVEEPVARTGPDDFDLGNLVVIYPQASAGHVGRGLVGDDHFGKGLAAIRVEQAAVMVDLQWLLVRKPVLMSAGVLFSQ